MYHSKIIAILLVATTSFLGAVEGGQLLTQKARSEARTEVVRETKATPVKEIQEPVWFEFDAEPRPEVINVSEVVITAPRPKAPKPKVVDMGELGTDDEPGMVCGRWYPLEQGSGMVQHCRTVAR